MTAALLLSLAGAGGFLVAGRGLLLTVFCLEVLLLGLALLLALASLEGGAGAGGAAVLLATASAGAETAVGLSLVVAGSIRERA